MNKVVFLLNVNNNKTPLFQLSGYKDSQKRK